MTMNSPYNPKLLLSSGVRIVLLLCFTVVFFLLVSVIVWFVLGRTGATTPAMRILAMAQDIFVFIVPALLTAIMVTRMPATLLAVDRCPGFTMTLLLIATFIASIPAMNALIAWNESIHLPESMKHIEDALRASELNAAQSVKSILGGDSIGDLIMGLLITGVAAGFSEELYFRGALQRLLHCGGMNSHLAVWIAAFIFSAIHLQFFGFVPRLLLGAFFGYALLWSGSLWLAVGAHVLNNSIYVLMYHLSASSEATDATTTSPHWALIGISIILTVIGITLMHRRYSAACASRPQS